MALNRYFQDELDALRRTGNEFAALFPRLSRHLSEQGSDPDVERLLEGFAFLTGRLREKIDDELPEVSQSVISLLWPNFLRPVPSMCMMRMAPIAGAIDQRQRLTKGAIIHAEGPEGRCWFRTCFDMEILPLEVVDARAESSRKASLLRLRFKTLNSEPLGKINLGKLRLYLGGSDYSALTLALWTRRYLGAAFVRYGLDLNDESGPRRLLPAESVRPGGFNAEDEALPYPNNAFPGYRMLQEYYAFPQRYYFLEIDALPPPPPGATALTVDLELNRPLPPDVRVDEGSFQLHCVPAINLFEHDADPILLDGRRVEYSVRPAGREAGAYDVFSIEEATGWTPGGASGGKGLTRTYHRFESFRHEMERAEARSAVYFRERVRQSMAGERLERLISFVSEDESHAADRRETISLRLLCTNGRAPLALGLGDLCRPGPGTPPFVKPANITRASPPLYPLLDGSLQWMLVSCLSLNYMSLLSRDALQTILFTYDFGARIDRQREREAIRRLEGIERIDTKTIDRMFKGLPVRGVRTTIRMRESRFGSEGEMHLFASVLSEFFSLYATINSFHQLDVLGVETGELYSWPPNIGRQPLL